MVGEFSKYAQVKQILSDKDNAVINNPLGVAPKLVIIATTDGLPSNKTLYFVGTEVCSGYAYTAGSYGTGAHGLPVEAPENVVAGSYYFGADRIVVGCAATVRAWANREYTIDIYA